MTPPDPGFWKGGQAEYSFELAEDDPEHVLNSLSAPILQAVWIAAKDLMRAHADFHHNFKLRIWSWKLSRWVKLNGEPLLNTEDGWFSVELKVLATGEAW